MDAENCMTTLFVNGILEPVGNAARAGQAFGGDLTGFLAVRGCLYRGDLMVVGRAVNGWLRGIASRDLAGPNSRIEYARMALNESRHGMGWVMDQWGAKVGYNTKRSPFWRVIRGVVDRLEIAYANCDRDDKEWPCHLAWSNLYKLSPAYGGNPSAALKAAQLEGCRELLKLELETYLPRRLLLITEKNPHNPVADVAEDWDWAEPFLHVLGTIDTVDAVGGIYVKGTGHLLLPGGRETQVVVAKRPEQQPSEVWVTEIVHAFT